MNRKDQMHGPERRGWRLTGSLPSMASIATGSTCGASRSELRDTHGGQSRHTPGDMRVTPLRVSASAPYGYAAHPPTGMRVTPLRVCASAPYGYAAQPPTGR